MNALNLFEAGIVHWIQENLRAGFLTPVMQLITALGDHGAFWIALTVLLLFFRRTRRAGLCCALALILDLLAVNIILKPLIARMRPYAVLQDIIPITALPGDHSFPSGHSAASFACAWALFRSGKRRMGIPALVLAALIALSRLYVGVHYPTDVICGAAIGMLAGEGGLQLGRTILKGTGKQPPDSSHNGKDLM